MKRRNSDKYVLDRLAEILRRPVWPSGADFLEWCADYVVSTGRDLQNGPTDQGTQVANRVNQGAPTTGSER